MISFTHRGNFSKTERFFSKMTNAPYPRILDKYGQQGVEALRAATPVDTGLTASSWYYTVEKSGQNYTITWNNSNVVRGINIAVILQHGHGTRNGGYVAGRDYINPAIRPIFDKIADEAWKEVTSV